MKCEFLLMYWRQQVMKKMKKNYPRVSSSSLKIMEPFWLTIVIISRLPDPGFNEDTSSVFVSSPTPASPWTSSSPSQTKLNTPLPWLPSVTIWSVTLCQDMNHDHCHVAVTHDFNIYQFCTILESSSPFIESLRMDVTWKQVNQEWHWRAPSSSRLQNKVSLIVTSIQVLHCKARLLLPLLV